MKGKLLRKIRHVGRYTLHAAAITVLAAVFSYSIIYSFTSMLALKSSIEVKDYQFSDLYSVVAYKSTPPRLNDSIVLVATDGLTRDEIARVLNTVQQSNPKVIGIDIIFEHPYIGDSLLIAATSSPNIVMAQMFDDGDDFAIHGSYFCNPSHLAQSGVTNIEYGVVRHFRHNFDLGGIQYPSFAAAVAIAGGHDLSQQSLYDSYICFLPHEFQCITPDIIRSYPEECDDILKDKIVLLGDIHDSHDMHQTPIGRLSGLKIQAAIIETIIGNHGILQVSSATGWAIAIISCFLIVLFNIILTENRVFSGKLIFRLAQLLLLYLFFWIGCYLFAHLNLYVDFAPVLALIAIALLVSDLYWGALALVNHVKHKYTRK